MCYRILRVRWCGHVNSIWRPGPRTCARAIRENRNRGRPQPCSQFTTTTSRAIDLPCNKRECRIASKGLGAGRVVDAKSKANMGNTATVLPLDSQEINGTSQSVLVTTRFAPVAGQGVMMSRKLFDALFEGRLLKNLAVSQLTEQATQSSPP